MLAAAMATNPSPPIYARTRTKVARMSSDSEYADGGTATSHQRCVRDVSRLEALPLRFLGCWNGANFRWRVNDGLQRRRGRGDRQCRSGDARRSGTGAEALL